MVLTNPRLKAVSRIKLSKVRAEDEGNVQLDITYEGSEINHQMPDHTVQSEENKELLNRKLERLRVEEAINVVDDAETLYPELFTEAGKVCNPPRASGRVRRKI